MDEKKSDSSQLAQVNTILAYSRTRAASERTMMAWVRTSMTMISFGFSISTFFRTLRKAEGLPPPRFAAEPMVFGLVLVFMGTVVLAIGAIQEYLSLRESSKLMLPFKSRGPWTFSLSFAMFMVGIGIATFVYMVYKSLH